MLENCATFILNYLSPEMVHSLSMLSGWDQSLGYSHWIRDMRSLLCGEKGYFGITGLW